MGLVLDFVVDPPPGRDIADDGIAARVNVDVLDAHGLLAATLQLVQ